MAQRESYTLPELITSLNRSTGKSGLHVVTKQKRITVTPSAAVVLGLTLRGHVLVDALDVVRVLRGRKAHLFRDPRAEADRLHMLDVLQCWSKARMHEKTGRVHP